MRFSSILIAVLAISTLGCTKIQVQPVEPSLDLDHVCIELNERVIVKDFLDVIQSGFSRHGINTLVVHSKETEECRYLLTYTALQSWDFTTYLSHAELTLFYRKEMIGNAVFHLKGKGGFSPAKWDKTKTKMDPVIDELLKNYH